MLALNGIIPITGCDNPERKADIIFVHGLGGDPFDTWRHQNDTSEKALDSWPYWLGRDFPEVGVWSIGYSSSPSVFTRVLRWIGLGSKDSGYTMPLVDRATQILDVMANKNLGKRPLMFICHSLGGLVVKQVLNLSNEASWNKQKSQVIRNTRVVMFLATPHGGVRLNFFFSFLLKLPGSTITIREICFKRSNITKLYRWYCECARAFNIETVSYREMRSLSDIFIIVDELSSYPGIGSLTPLDEDHLSIAKPKKTDNQVYENACRLVKEHLLQSSSQEEKPTNFRSKILHLEKASKRDFVLICPTKYNTAQKADKMIIIQTFANSSFESLLEKNQHDEKEIVEQINSRNNQGVRDQIKGNSFFCVSKFNK